MTDEEILLSVHRRIKACPNFRAMLIDAANRQRRVEAAVSMFASGMARIAVQAALRERFAISDRHARNIIAQALRLRIETRQC